MRLIIAAGLLLGAVPATAGPGREAAPPTIESLGAEVHAILDDYRTARQVPGSVYGIVKDGRLVLVEGLGVRDPATKVPVDADTRFRIASMSKAFTALAILMLRDEGKVSLEAPASRYVPEMNAWKSATGDSRPITVRDLLHHTAGFVEDNPWGDRQQVLTPTEFTALIKGGMDFAGAPGAHYEYSNYGYALLGRIVSNVSGQRYQDFIRSRIMVPLGMTSTGYDVFAGPAGSRAIGSRWQDGEWIREPDMRDGEFGAMGGLETTANDYAKWMAFLLSAWPASDGPEAGPAKRSTVRDLAGLVAPGPSIDRPAEVGAPCRVSYGYGAGLQVWNDCDLGRIVRHTGGYPGYGSVMMLLPEAGDGIFSFSNLTYTSMSAAAWKALVTLRQAGAIPDRALPVSDSLAAAYAIAKAAWSKGTIDGVPVANNVAMDRAPAQRASDIAGLKKAVGACTMAEPIVPVSSMEGHFTWTCEKGRITGRVQRAPTAAMQLQVINFRLGD